MITLLWVLFGWMDVLIIIKWLHTWEDKANPHGRDDAPAIIPTMINNFLNGGVQTKYIFDPAAQRGISNIFILIAFITVPVMLCVKPCYIGRQHKAIHVEEQKQPSIIDVEKQALNPVESTKNIEDDIQRILKDEAGGDEEHAMSELFIH